MFNTNDTDLLERIKSTQGKKSLGSLFEKPIASNLLKIKKEDISETSLANANIKKIKWDNVRAPEINWTNIKIQGGTMNNVIMHTAILTNVVFENVYFSNFNLSFSTLNGVIFKNCVIEGAGGLHTFGKSFNNLQGTGVSFIDSKMSGVLLRESNIALEFLNSSLYEVTMSALKYPSTIKMKDVTAEWIKGDYSFLKSLSIDNSHFKKSKFNEVNVGEVLLSRLKGRLPVTGNLGNVKVDRLETDESYMGGGVFLSFSVIYSLDIEGCCAETEIGLFRTSFTKLRVLNCNVDILDLEEAKVDEFYLHTSKFKELNVSESAIKQMELNDVTVDETLNSELAVAEQSNFKNIKIARMAEVSQQGSNLPWDEHRFR